MASDEDWLLVGPTEPDDVRRRYDDWADEYDAAMRGWGYDAPERAAHLLLAGLAAECGSPSVLDAGCGTGLVGAALRSAGFAGRLVGVDLSATSLDQASNRNAYDELQVVDLHRPLPHDSGVFSGLVCVGVLSYVPDTLAIWREFARVVHPGGTVVCTYRSDVWHERGCASVLDELERDGTWTTTHLSPPLDYMPGNPDFGHEIGVRYLAASVRA